MQKNTARATEYGATDSDPHRPPPDYGEEYGTSYTDNAIGRQELGEKETFEQVFRLQRPKYNDLWAGILLLIVFAGYVAISVISLKSLSRYNDIDNGDRSGRQDGFTLDPNTIILFVVVVAAAFALATGYLALARMFTKQFIWITCALNVALGIATAIYMLAMQYWSGGIVFLVFSVISIFIFLSWRKRIPFSVLMLQTATDVSKSYGHVFLVSIIGGILAVIFGVWWTATLVAVFVRYSSGTEDAPNPVCSRDGSCSDAKVIGFAVFITFAMFWISEWIKNTIHTTISGVYGSWYFCVHNLPIGPTRGAFKRAMTLSFGSISFGSLIVAVLNFLKAICDTAREQARQQNNPVLLAVFCCLGCLVGVVDWAVQFLNRYAFSHIALYGKAYIEAAKDTWKMIKDRGIDALINDCLIGPVLGMGGVFVGYACALIAYLYLVATDPAYNRDGDYTALIVAFAFLIGLQVTHIMTNPLSSGIDTIFVAMAWDPHVMATEHPELWQQMVEVYPRVQLAIQGGS